MSRIRFCWYLLLVLALNQAAHGQTFRTITVRTEPQAKVWVDNVFYGTTGKDGTLQIKTIAAGSHTLRVRADGFKEKTQPLAAAQRGDVSVALAAAVDEAELAFQEGERQSTQNREKAAAAYRNAVKLRPNYPEAYLALARTLADAGSVLEAEKAANQARKLRPGYAEASAVLGRIYKDEGEEAKAIAAFKRAITEGRGVQPEAYAGLGLLYKEKAETAGSDGDYEGESAAYTEAAKNLRMSIKQLSGAPDAIVIYQLLGLIYERQKKTADAIAAYEEFLRIFPDAPEATAVRSFIVQLQKER
jgi:tetratricopeptide (TPR) repeat protein